MLETLISIVTSVLTNEELIASIVSGLVAGFFTGWGWVKRKIKKFVDGTETNIDDKFYKKLKKSFEKELNTRLNK